MKKLLITTSLLASLYTHAMAQVYYKLGFGQGFTSAGQTAIFDQPYQGTISYDQGTGKLSTFNVKNVSFGAGTHAVISVGDMFGKHVGGELSALIGIAPKKLKGQKVSLMMQMFTKIQAIPCMRIAD